MNKILITGGSGFIGTNLVNFYTNLGWTVKNIDINSPKDSQATNVWECCDINNYDTLSACLQNYSPDYIVHLAARTDLDGANVDDYQANTIGVENILKISSKLPTLKKILITSK